MGLEELRELKEWYFSGIDLVPKGMHWNSTPEMVYDLAERLLIHGNREMRIVDMGAGHGFVQNALRTLGWQHVYGVELDIAPSEHSARSAAEMGLPRPQVIIADYHASDLFEKGFDDGTTLQDIDFFFHYSYNVFGALDMMINVLAGPRRAKLDSLAFIADLPLQKTRWAGFEPVRHPFFTEPCIRKVGAPAVCMELHEAPSRRLESAKVRIAYS